MARKAIESKSGPVQKRLNVRRVDIACPLTPGARLCSMSFKRSGAVQQRHNQKASGKVPKSATKKINKAKFRQNLDTDYLTMEHASVNKRLQPKKPALKIKKALSKAELDDSINKLESLMRK